MMTLEEVWENLRKDPKIKATMEEVEKSYKLFKKIENLIVADLEAKLAEKDAEVQSWKDGTMVVKLGKLEQQLAEERKKVVQEIREKLCKCDEYDCCCIDNMNINEVHKFLDQIERGDV